MVMSLAHSIMSGTQYVLSEFLIEGRPVRRCWRTLELLECRELDRLTVSDSWVVAEHSGYRLFIS